MLVLDPAVARMPVARDALVTQDELQKLIGLPYSEEHDCYWLVRHFFALEGYEIDADIFKAMKHFSLADRPARYLDIVYFKTPDHSHHHVGVMIDDRYAVQTSEIRGVSRIDVYRSPWAEMFTGLYRHKSRCC